MSQYYESANCAIRYSKFGKNSLFFTLVTDITIWSLPVSGAEQELWSATGRWGKSGRTGDSKNSEGTYGGFARHFDILVLV